MAKHAARPKGKGGKKRQWHGGAAKKNPPPPGTVRKEGGKDGGYLLSRLRSTIGAAELNCPVRNGKGWNLRTKATSMGCGK